MKLLYSLLNKMAVMYTFCRYFSVRLGAILVAASSLIQSIILMGLFLVWLHDVEVTTERLKEWVESNKLIYVSELFQSIEENTQLYLESTIVFLMLHITTCALLIFAAFKCNVPFTWPFLVVEFVRLAIFFFSHVTAMMLIKENILDLGLLIALSLTGGVILLGLYYNWFCVVSLCQCVRELSHQSPEAKPHRPLRKSDITILASDFKHLTKQVANTRAHALLGTPPLSQHQLTNITK